MIYLLIVLYLIFLIYIYDYKGLEKKRILYYKITVLILVLLAGLRYRIGSDTLAYEISFNAIPTIGKLTWRYVSEVSDYEIGFTVLVSLVKTIFGHFWCFLIIQSFVINYFICRFFRKNTKNIFTAILIYFVVLYYFVNCEAARQGIALAILLNSWPCFINGKMKKMCTIIIIASLFHISAIIFLILPILKICKLWDKLRPNIVSGIIIVSIIIANYFIQQFVSQTLLEYMVDGDIGGRVNFYYNDAHELSGISILTQLIYVVFYIIIPFCCLKKLKGRYCNYNNLASIVILCSFFNVASGIPMVYRLTYYFIPFYFIMVSESLFTTTNSNVIESKRKHINILILSFLSLFFFYKMQHYFYEDGSSSKLKYYMRFYPYNSVIEKGIDINREEIYRGI